MRFLASFLVFSLLITQADAIVIRHDSKSEVYHADSADYPALFALYKTDKGYNECVATLIAPQWAITAAHCTEDPALDRLAGSSGYPVMVNNQKRLINKVVRHEAAEQEQPSDFALLHFSEAITDTQPISLYTENNETGKTVFIPGWGDTGNGIDGITGADGQFRIAQNIVDTAMDGWLIWKFDNPDSENSNALPLEGISGPGDSGGPALIRTQDGLFIAGVSSGQDTFGKAEGLYGAEEYFVRVSHFADWIDQVINTP